MTLKILEVATDVHKYKVGISRLVGLLYRGLKKRGHHVDILTPKIRFREFKLSLIPFAKYRDYDVIHLHGPTPFLSDMLWMTNDKSRIVYTHHADICWLSDKLSKLYRDFHRVLAKKAQAIVVHSHDYASSFKESNVFLVHMPCTFVPPNNSSMKNKTNPFKVLFVGQLRPFKGVNLLIEAAKMLPSVDFMIVGEGYLKPKLSQMAKGLDNVKLYGAIPDEKLKELYKQAHVICLPSLNTTEAYGIVLIEGALYGCVPLASNLKGVRENVSNLKGMVFDPNSSVSLTNAIKKLSSKKQWNEISERSFCAAKNYVNTYTPEYYVEMHERIFQRVNNLCTL